MTYVIEVDLTLITRVLLRPEMAANNNNKDVLLDSKLHIDNSEAEVNIRIILTVQYHFMFSGNKSTINLSYKCTLCVFCKH